MNSIFVSIQLLLLLDTSQKSCLVVILSSSGGFIVYTEIPKLFIVSVTTRSIAWHILFHLQILLKSPDDYCFKEMSEFIDTAVLF